MRINRVWAMPSMHTFLIPPIAELVHRYVGDGKGWIDCFAGENSPAEITNDLNPNKPAQYHLTCEAFAEIAPNSYGCLFDKPYSGRQMKEVYEGVGMDFGKEESQQCVRFSKAKDILAPKISDYVLSFGWNSAGFGNTRGFEIIEILLVAHGSAHNDTICVVERKFRDEIPFKAISSLTS